ncbi:MAG: type III-A CRISPR-associated protein Cas10/Csm1 [Chloroflexota bacterium]
MKDQVFNAALAGLLHDIGKVIQRARVDPWKAAEGTEGEGQPVHASYSIQFVQNYVPQAYQSAALAGTYHHHPEKSHAQDPSLSMLVSLADRLSAGERERDEPEDKQDKPQQLITIFDRIKDAGQKEYHYLPLQPLALQKSSLFPDRRLEGKKQGDRYENLKDLLVSSFKENDSQNPQTYLETCLSILQRCTWCVPSSYYYDLPDVSLYDHARMTAALAVCLLDFEAGKIKTMRDVVTRAFQDKAQQAKDEQVLGEPVALLVGGDISGIQNFIYTLSSKRAAQTLRGRSFYLQLLTEAVLRYVLRQLDLPYTNVIYSGGGHFFLLAPLSAADKLKDIQRYITHTLLEHHGSDLYLAVGSAEVPVGGFKAGKFPTYWAEMHAQLAMAKQHRYTELGNELYEQVFKPQGHGGNAEKTCSVCGEEKDHVEKFKDEEAQDNKICGLCFSFFEQIGKELPHVHAIKLGLGDAGKIKAGTAMDVLAAFGMAVSFDEKDNFSRSKVPNIQRAVQWILDDIQPPAHGLELPVSPLYRYTVNQIPYDEKGRETKTFDDLQKEVRGGFKQLGVLRMDVDYLGDLFKTGLTIKKKDKEENIATLARLSTLSFQTSLFFEGWVKQLCETGDYKNEVYAVYAGGDDLFLIAPWDLVPKLALQIRRDFREYVAGNSAIHLSGGMAFIGGKYPIYQAADDAGDALDDAKHIDKDALLFEGKNAFHFLGHAWKWDVFEKLDGKFERLLKIVQKKGDGEEAGLGGSQSILQLLQNLARLEGDKKRSLKSRRVWGPWMWLGDYMLFRMKKQNEKNEALAREFDAILEDLRKDMYLEIDQWGTAARWAQLYVRK